MTIHRPIFAGALALLAGCAAMQNIEEERASGGIGNAIVVDDESFSPSRGTMLSILQMHVRGMSVSRSGTCPRIIVRGGASRSILASPLVYIDGQRISDTCVLDMLEIDAVERAEVYPSGVTNRPGYNSNAGGLILVFLKNGPEKADW